jgi:hypothetical protein
MGNGTLVPMERGDGRARRCTIGGTAVPGARRHQSGLGRTLSGVTTPSAAPRLRAFAMAMMLGLGAMAAACSGDPASSFDPTGPCITDGSAPGAYPDLEARIPTSYEGQGPGRLDSGRHCTPENLGSLAAAGIAEVRYAGGTWDFGGDRAAALAVFQAEGLTADFYAQSARAANRTTITGESTPTLAGRPGHRLDTTTGSRTQTIVVWPSADSGVVDVVITNDLPDPKIQAAVDAFGGR